MKKMLSSIWLIIKKYKWTWLGSISLSFLLSCLYYLSENLTTNFFDVSYDVDTVHTSNGVETISDRKTILDFLTAANRTNNYKFIFLDLHFKEGQHKLQDDSIVRLINEMNRDSKRVMIVKPSIIETGIITDSIFESCFSAPNGFRPSFINSNFTRYSYIQSGVPSAAIQIFNANVESPINPQLFHLPIINCDLFKDENYFFVNSPIVNIPSEFQVTEKRNLKIYLQKNSRTNDTKIANDLRGKYVFVGAFELDRRNTYSGERSGSHLTYLALKELQNRCQNVNSNLYMKLMLIYAFLLMIIFHHSPYQIVKSIITAIIHIIKIIIVALWEAFHQKYLVQFDISNYKTLKAFVFTEALLKRIPRLSISVVAILIANIGFYSIIFMGLAIYIHSSYGIIYNIQIPVLFYTVIESLKPRKES